MCCLFGDDNYSNRCKVQPQFSFICFCLVINAVEHFNTFCHFHIFFWKHWSFACFQTGLLPLECCRSLQILETNYLSDGCLQILFPILVGCLGCFLWMFSLLLRGLPLVSCNHISLFCFWCLFFWERITKGIAWINVRHLLYVFFKSFHSFAARILNPVLSYFQRNVYIFLSEYFPRSLL